MLNPTLTKSYAPGGAISKYRIVKFGSADGAVVQAAAATDKLVGVTTALDAASTDARVDVIRAGIAEVEYGGNVTRGDLLTADANGKAITATAAAGSNVRTIGVAEVSGVSGDIGSVLVAPGSFQG
jgi:hypothetical protein